MAKEKSSLIGIEEAKRWLRRALIRKRQAIPLQKKKLWSAKAVSHLTRLSLYKKAKTIALFLGFGSEIDTHALVRQAWKDRKNVLIPICERGFDSPYFALFHRGDRLRKTAPGPMELIERKNPFNFRKIDLVIIPGLGFDRNLVRLGYGGGVYDRILKQTRRAKHLGLFFSSQFIPVLPRSSHDHPIQGVVTEHGLTLH